MTASPLTLALMTSRVVLESYLQRRVSQNNPWWFWRFAAAMKWMHRCCVRAMQVCNSCSRQLHSVRPVLAKGVFTTARATCDLLFPRAHPAVTVAQDGQRAMAPRATVAWFHKGVCQSRIQHPLYPTNLNLVI